MNIEERPFYLIPAVPSSGTSALAGVLYHLGVNMGSVNHDKAMDKRGYEMYEDEDIWKFCACPNMEEDDYVGKLSRTILRLRSYINYRLASDPPGLVGAKIPGVLCVHDPEIETLPLKVLNVHRQFEKCLASDRATMVRAGRYKNIEGDIDKIVAMNRMRAGDMGACLAGKMDLMMFHEPIVNITFDELVGNKEEVVPQIAKALGLKPSEEVLQSAIDFLDNDKKHS